MLTRDILWICTWTWTYQDLSVSSHGPPAINKPTLSMSVGIFNCYVYFLPILLHIPVLFIILTKNGSSLLWLPIFCVISKIIITALNQLLFSSLFFLQVACLHNIRNQINILILSLYSHSQYTINKHTPLHFSYAQIRLTSNDRFPHIYQRHSISWPHILHHNVTYSHVWTHHVLTTSVRSYMTITQKNNNLIP